MMESDFRNKSNVAWLGGLLMSGIIRTSAYSMRNLLNIAAIFLSSAWVQASELACVNTRSLAPYKQRSSLIFSIWTN